MAHRSGRASARRLRLSIAAAAIAAAVVGAAPASAAVIPGDAYTFALAGFNATSGVGYILGSGYSTTFGTTQTFAGAGYNGQDYTITSSEVVGATTTTDTFVITTPTNFLTSATINGTTITALQFDLGDANSGVGVSTGSNPIDFSSPVLAVTATGLIKYGSANTVFALTPTATLSNGGLSVSAVEGVNYGASAINSLAIHEFDLSITYANPVTAAVPEPATWAMMIGGFGLVGGALRRRRAGAGAVLHA